MKKTYVIFLLCLILNTILFFQKPQNDDDFNTEIKESKILINLENEEIELEEYIIGVVACEMPASFENEALKAMAVASRTFALNKIYNNQDYIFSKSISDQCYNDNEEMKNKWQEEYDFYYEKIKNAVNDTKSEYLSYEDKPIKAYYFSTSNGYTENVSSVFGGNEDYLVSVDSSWDKESKPYFKAKELLVNDFKELLDIKENYIDIQNIIKSDTNHVSIITINNKDYTGIEMRKKLNLRSTDFDIYINDDKVLITTYGYGHGVGLSQYGANYLAKEGNDYKYILNYYYKDVSLKMYKL